MNSSIRFSFFHWASGLRRNRWGARSSECRRGRNPAGNWARATAGVRFPNRRGPGVPICHAPQECGAPPPPAAVLPLPVIHYHTYCAPPTYGVFFCCCFLFFCFCGAPLSYSRPLPAPAVFPVCDAPALAVPPNQCRPYRCNAPQPAALRPQPRSPRPPLAADWRAWSGRGERFRAAETRAGLTGCLVPGPERSPAC